MQAARISLLFVVFIDVMGIGLVLPMVSMLILDPSTPFLAADTTKGTRDVLYGILIGIFFLAWFAGAILVAKVSDYIGRKKGVLICLLGALIGYALTIVSLEVQSYWLLVFARAITGFTAANQPIAQAALVDISRDEAEKTRNLGLIVASSALGLLIGPLMAGILSDKAILGSYATLELPFYAALGLVVVNIVLVLTAYVEEGFITRKIDFGVSEVALSIWRATKYPAVLRLCIILFFALLTANAYYVFLDTYLFQVFKFDTLMNSIAAMVFGVSMAFASAVLTSYLTERYKKLSVVASAMVVMAAGIAVFLVNNSAFVSFVLILPVSMGLGIVYPTMLALFSASVSEEERGWVMGLTVALYSLGTGLVSILGGWLMSIYVGMPMVVAIVSAAVTVALIAAFNPDTRLKEVCLSSGDPQT